MRGIIVPLPVVGRFTTMEYKMSFGYHDNSKITATKLAMVT